MSLKNRIRSLAHTFNSDLTQIEELKLPLPPEEKSRSLYTEVLLTFHLGLLVMITVLPVEDNQTFGVSVSVFLLVSEALGYCCDLLNQ